MKNYKITCVTTNARAAKLPQTTVKATNMADAKRLAYAFASKVHAANGAQIIVSEIA